MSLFSFGFLRMESRSDCGSESFPLFPTSSAWGKYMIWYTGTSGIVLGWPPSGEWCSILNPPRTSLNLRNCWHTSLYQCTQYIHVTAASALAAFLTCRKGQHEGPALCYCNLLLVSAHWTNSRRKRAQTLFTFELVITSFMYLYFDL